MRQQVSYHESAVTVTTNGDAVAVDNPFGINCVDGGFGIRHQLTAKTVVWLHIAFANNGERRIIEYSCFEAPGPLQSHRARMEVRPVSSGCQLLWQAEVMPVELEDFIRTSMEGCLNQLQTLLAS